MKRKVNHNNHSNGKLSWKDGKRRLGDLIEWSENPVTINESNANRLVSSLSEFGQIMPIAITPDNVIADGNQRKKVWSLSKRFGKNYKVDVRIASRKLTRTERQRLAILLRSGTVGEYDWERISAWDADLLKSAGLDHELLEQLNRDQAALIDLIGSESEEIEPEPQDPSELIDRAEELQKKWQCESGDIWMAAGHFWICGDCREFETWRKLLEAAKVERVNGVFTSPPYAEQRKAQYGGVPTDQYVEWWNEVQANVRANLAEDGSFFVNIKPHCENGERVLYVFDLVLAMRRQWGWRFVDELIWKHQGYPGGYLGRFRNEFEPVYHFSISDNHKHYHKSVLTELGETHQKHIERKKAGDAPYQKGYENPNAKSGMGGFGYYKELEGRQHGNVIEIPLGANSEQSASFPVALPEFFVKAYSDSGDVWIDPFLGSGTTIIAAHRNGRRGLGIEKLEKYTAVICERIEKETGETPKRIDHAKA